MWITVSMLFEMHALQLPINTPPFYLKKSMYGVTSYQKALDNSGYKHLLTFSSNTRTQTSDSKRKNRKREIIWYNPPLARRSPLTSGVPSLSYLTRNLPRSRCYIRSLTGTPSRSATVACQTTNKTSTATANPFYTRRSCRRDLAIVYRVETASRNRLFTKRLSRQKIITLPRPTWD